MIAIIVTIAVCLAKRKKKDNVGGAVSVAPLHPPASSEFASARDESPRSQEYARFTANSTADLSTYASAPAPAMTTTMTSEYGSAPPAKSEYGAAPSIPSDYG